MQLHGTHSPGHLGCYTVLFAVAIYLKLNGPAHLRSLSNPLFIITVTLYLACSSHFYLDLSHFYKVLVCAMPYSSYAISDSEH
jgi:hypothetical protein